MVVLKITKIVYTLLATVFLLLSVGGNITQMHCPKGSKVFFGTDNSSCHLQEAPLCTQAKSKKSCCKSTTNESSQKLPCNKQTIEFSYDFDSVISSVYNVECEIVLNSLSNKIFVHHTSHIFERLPQTYLKDRSPPLVSKPILSKIQSFLI